MSVSTARFLLLFGVRGASSLTRVRSDILGMQRTTYGASNAMSRSFSSLEKNMTRSSNIMSNSIRKLTGNMRILGGLSIAGLIGGSIVGAANAINNAFIKTNTQLQTSKIMLEELLGKGKAPEFMKQIQEKSAVFGQDLNETFAASRGLLQVMKQIGNGNVMPKQLDKMLSMVMAVSTMDLENRGLSYTAFSFKEALQGMGRGDFRSLRNRLEINLGKGTENGITKALKAGQLDKAIDLFDSGLKRIGINSNRLLQRMMSEGFGQNVSRLQGYFSMSFQKMGLSLFTSLTRPLAQLNTYISEQFKEGSSTLKIFDEISNDVAGFFQPAIDKSVEFGKEIRKRASEVVPEFRKMFGAGAGSSKEFLEMFRSFSGGLFGNTSKRSDDGVTSLINGMKSLTKFGNGLRDIFFQMQDPLQVLGASIKDVVKEFAILFGGNGSDKFAKNIGTIASGLVLALNPIVRLAQVIPRIMNMMSGNDPNNPTQEKDKNGFQNAMGYVGAGVGVLSIIGMLRGFRGGKIPKVSSGGSNNVTNLPSSSNTTLNTKRSSIASLEGLEQSNRAKLVGLNGNIRSNIGSYRNLPMNKSAADKLASEIMSREARIATLQSKINARKSTMADPSDFERNPHKYHRLSSMTRKMQLEQAGLSSVRGQFNNKMSDVNSGRRVEKMMDDRDRLLNKNRAVNGRMSGLVDGVKNMSTQEKIFNGILGVQVVQMAKSFGGMLVGKLMNPITKVGLGMTGVGGIFATFVAANPFGAAVIALVAGVGALTLSLEGLTFWANNKTKEEEKNQADEKSNTDRKVWLQEYARKRGINVQGMQKFFQHGWAGGKIENSKQYSTLFHTMLKGSAEQNILNGLASDMQKGIITPEEANAFAGGENGAALLGQQKMIVGGFLDISGYSDQAKRDMVALVQQAIRNEKVKTGGYLEGNAVGMNTTDRINPTELSNELSGN